MDEEYENQNMSQRNGPNALQTMDSFISRYADNKAQKDIDAINNRKKDNPNENLINPLTEENKKDSDNKEMPKKDGLGEKKGLENKKDKPSDNKNKNQSPTNKRKAEAEAKKKAQAEAKKKAQEAAKKKAEQQALKSKAALKIKMKIYLYIGAAALGLLSIIFLVAFFSFAFNNLTSSISSFFGISEKGLNDDDENASVDDQLKDGLYTDDKYKYVKPDCDVDNYSERKCKCDNSKEECKELGAEDLVKVLYSDDACHVDSWFYNFLDNIVDIVDFTGFFTDECQLVRYIRGSISKYESRFNTKLDPGLILASIFYGYDQQAHYRNYKEGAEDAEFDSSAEHFQVLANIIKDGKLKKEDVDRLIQNSIFEEVYPYWNWSIICNKDSDGNDTDVCWGYCTSKMHKSYKYSSDKWKMFIRWNDEKDDKSRKDFSVPGYVGYGISKVLDYKITGLIGNDPSAIWGSGYVYDTNLNSAYTTTDDECNGTYTEAQLISMYDLEGVRGLDESTGFFEKNGYEGIIDTSHYFQKVQEINSTDKDVFTQHEVKYLRQFASSYSTYTIKYNYNEGFGYVDFPGFKEAMDDPKTDLKYDDAITPKEVETIVEEVMDKKKQLNEVLLAQDMDNDLYGENGTYDENGNYIEGIVPNTDGIVTTNANCKAFLTSDLDKINVNINTCDGKPMGTVGFKDYIIGVTKAEIDSYNRPNYTLTAMIAEISYALNRRNNYTKGSTITMRSGNCDQAFSSPKNGCHGETSGIVCGYKNGEPFNCTSYVVGPSSSGGYFKRPMSDAEYAAYEKLYEEASKYLVIKNGKIMQTGYVSSTQNKWEKMEKEGANFVEIIKTIYPEGDLIKCYDENENTETDTSEQ